MAVAIPPEQVARNFFRQQFHYPPVHVARAPGRVELLGNHTDYNQGLVLAAAVDRAVFIASAPRFDGRIELVSSAFPKRRDLFWLSDFKKNPTAPWADYVKGTLHQLRRHGVGFSGFNAAIHSTIPIGAGLGSSGALTVATALMVRQLHPCRFTSTAAPPLPRPTGKRKAEIPPLSKKEKLIVAEICRAAENDFVGVHCGMLDQLAALFGQAYHALEIDFMHLTVECRPMIGEISIVVCDSGVKHSLASGAYNELRRHCESATKKLGLKSLRSLELNQLNAGGRKLNDREYSCAYHNVGENARVAACERVLFEEDFTQFGHFMFESHESSRDFLQNSCHELDLLVELARAHPACLGARLTGGGFGGATVNLVARSLVLDFMETMSKGYERTTGRKMTPLLLQLADGAE
jgi:galactokinase